MKDDNRIETAAGLTPPTGGDGKVGRRVACALAARGKEIRIGSRSGTPAFDWEDAGTWEVDSAEAAA